MMTWPDFVEVVFEVLPRCPIRQVPHVYPTCHTEHCTTIVTVVVTVVVTIVVTIVVHLVVSFARPLPPLLLVRCTGGALVKNSIWQRSPCKRHVSRS